MRLRTQLMLVSLLVLCLPWAGCQFVREVESAMLAGQERALLATANAVAQRFAAEESLLPPDVQRSGDARAIYFHALPSAPVIDGFGDEWRHYALDPASFWGQDVKGESPLGLLSAGTYRGDGYLFIEIADATLNLLDPSKDPLKSGDYLRVVIDGLPDLYLGASAPGDINARYLQNGEVRSEYGISGVWNHTGIAYQIELRIRSRIFDLRRDVPRLGLEFVDIGPSADIRTNTAAVQSEKHSSHFQRIGFDAATNVLTALPIAQTDPVATDALAVFAGDGLRLSLIDKQGWLRARAGKLYTEDEMLPAQHGLLTRFYRTILNSEDITELEPWERQGRVLSPDVIRALETGSSVERFALNNQKIGRGTVALTTSQLGLTNTLGAIIVEQTAESLTTASLAFNRLLFWSLVALSVVGFGLLFYASLLSYRIRRLSKAADGAVDDKGHIDAFFPVSKFDDEIGDLSRSFGGLLARLREYTEYLKSLSGKLSHELKTPLAIVRSSLENVERQELGSENAKYLHRAQEGADRLSKIFSALSNASRLEALIEGAELEEFNLSEILQAVFLSYVDAYPKTKIRLVMAPSAGKMRLLGSPELFVQMLDKLVDNAVDFCIDGGEVRLSLSCRETLCDVGIFNNGQLINTDMQGQLFDSLVSIRNPETKKTGSDTAHLGLGLHVAKLIAEFHGGSVALVNQPEELGVSAIVRLPCIQNPG